MATAAQWLEDETAGLPEPAASSDASYPWRRLACAVIVQAVADFKRPDMRAGAVRFLRPQTVDGRDHLLRMADAAGLSLPYVLERLERLAHSTPQNERRCLKCKARVPVADFSPRPDGSRDRYCASCRRDTPFCSNKSKPRGKRHLRSS